MTRLGFPALLVLAFGLMTDVLTKSPSQPEGVLPVGANGKPLNLDFETGTLQDWHAEGDAFAGQPVKGDTVLQRRPGMRSRHQGQYWIGSYERRGDPPQGTLTSVPFKITHPWATFLVGGGPWPSTCVELILKDSGKIFFRASGIEEEDLRPVAVDLRPYQGKEMFIRLVDRHTGHWGHINFDNFRFHAARPNVPERPAYKALPAPDVYPYAGLPPEKAAEVMTVPPGFTVKLFAGEPDVFQPIAFCLDDRGRVWVAEAYSYPVRRPDKEARDRIVIFEDTDGDGKFDKRTVFMEGLNLVSGLEVGFGGVWIGAAPYFMFVPVKAGGDRPAGPPQILLDGWAYQDTHETLNTFTWGPDGWLYGCHGVFTHSRVAKPGTPASQRIPLNAGIWRYHPTKHIFEVFAEGTSNPWGLDFNAQGDWFCEACVIPHAFHVIQGARYQRQAGNHFNPYTYEDIQTIADHRHWVGANPHGGNERSDSAGGGHAHCGTMIYLGGAWPREYWGKWFMGNIHGRRLNMDILHPKSSGYVASHGHDFLLANDAWARFINFRYGPDGNVYLIDWYDKQACHVGSKAEAWDRTNGRVYKICYRGAKPLARPVNLQKCSDAELVAYQLEANDWYARHARRILQERFASGKRAGAQAAWDQVHRPLIEMATKKPDPPRRLRALWALHAVSGPLRQPVLGAALADRSEHVRGWAIQLALEGARTAPPDRVTVDTLAQMARTDPSPVVRRYLASGLQRLPYEDRWDILAALLAHGEDASDHNLPLLCWYGAEPLAGVQASRALALATNSKIPKLLPLMVRRIGSAGTPEALALLVAGLEKTDDEAARLTILHGLQQALQGRRQVAMPQGWPDAYSRLNTSRQEKIRIQARALAVTFGDGRAIDEMRRLLANEHADAGQRHNALDVLLRAGDKQLAPVLLRLLTDRELRGAALRGLAAYADPEAPAAILKTYPSLETSEKRDALHTLTARVAYGRALLDAIAGRQIAATEVSADLVRQLRNLNDKDLDRRIADVWGVVRATAADRKLLMVKYRKLLAAPGQPLPDRSLGRAVFAKTCQQCHTLFGVGGNVGPDITGSNRANLDYLLENILDPSAVIQKEYTATVIELKDGRVITGIVRGETPAALTVVNANGTLVIPRGEIETRATSKDSMMPDDLLKALSAHEVRSLIAYLQSPSQVALPAAAEVKAGNGAREHP
jgi:putative membrane-bound dehydrogenase-like protein